MNVLQGTHRTYHIPIPPKPLGEKSIYPKNRLYFANVGTPRTFNIEEVNIALW